MPLVCSLRLHLGSFGQRFLGQLEILGILHFVFIGHRDACSGGRLILDHQFFAVIENEFSLCRPQRIRMRKPFQHSERCDAAAHCFRLKRNPLMVPHLESAAHASHVSGSCLFGRERMLDTLQVSAIRSQHEFAGEFALLVEGLANTLNMRQEASGSGRAIIGGVAGA